MGSVATSSPQRLDAPVDGFLPGEYPLEMVTSDFSRAPQAMRQPVPAASAMWLRRTYVFAATIALTGAGAYEMYKVLEVGGVTILEWMVLALFVALLAWVGFSFASALAGFFVLLGRRGNALPIVTSGALPDIA